MKLKTVILVAFMGLLVVGCTKPIDESDLKSAWDSCLGLGIVGVERVMVNRATIPNSLNVTCTGGAIIWGAKRN